MTLRDPNTIILGETLEPGDDLRELILGQKAKTEREFKEQYGFDMYTVPGVDPTSRTINNAAVVPPEAVAEAHATLNMLNEMTNLSQAVDFADDERPKVRWFLDRIAGQLRLQLQDLSQKSSGRGEHASQMQTISDEMLRIEHLKERLGIGESIDQQKNQDRRQVDAAEKPLRDTQFAH